MAFSNLASGAHRSSRSRFACACFLLLTLLGNLAMPLAAQGAASWASAHGLELIPICTAQGVRLVPLTELMPELADSANGPAGLDGHSSDPARPSQGGSFGHCDACLGGVNSLAAPADRTGLACAGLWRSPQVPALAREVIPYPVTHSAEARGPPVIA